MKIRWVIVLGILVLTGLSFICIASLAIIMGHAQSEIGIPVSYVKEESDAYALSVEVRGDGEICCKDGSEDDILRRSQKVYLLKVDEEASFKLYPDKGDGIKSITLDDKDITNSIANDRVIIKGQEKPQHLLIVFNSNQSSVRTGITGFLGQRESTVILAFLAISTVLFLGKRKIFKK
ncbi:hypothetical protein [Eubacterium sp.]|uniref:hypothetical protein n=1 Tax=Eubacterium sp. TaxID=142586 RepID=UPI002FC60B21